MSTNRKDERRERTERLKYGMAEVGNTTESLDVSQVRLGQMNPQHYPQSNAKVSRQKSNEESDNLLGQPMKIEDVASLLGCSVWTVRQRYLPQGLPHLRASSSGRIVFFREQVIGWILRRQEHQARNRHNDSKTN